MENLPRDTSEYLRLYAGEMAERISQQFPPLYRPGDAMVRAPSVFCVSRERAKLHFFWRHAYLTPRSGPFNGCVVNPDTGVPVLTGTDQLRRDNFRKARHSEYV